MSTWNTVRTLLGGGAMLYGIWGDSLSMLIIGVFVVTVARIDDVRDKL